MSIVPIGIALLLAICACDASNQKALDGAFELRLATLDPRDEATDARFELRDLAGAKRIFYASSTHALRLGAEDVSQLDIVRHEGPTPETTSWSILVGLSKQGRQRVKQYVSPSADVLLVTVDPDFAIAATKPEFLLANGELIFFIVEEAAFSQFEEQAKLVQPVIRSDSSVDRQETCRTAAGSNDQRLESCLRLTNRDGLALEAAILDRIERGLDDGTMSPEEAVELLEQLEE